MSDIERKLGQRVAQLRKDAHLTQAALAEKLDVETETVSRWERAANVPDLDQLRALADVFGMELWELLRFSPEPDRMKTPSVTPMDRAMERLTKVARRSSPEFVDAVTDVARAMAGRWPRVLPRPPARPSFRVEVPPSLPGRPPKLPRRVPDPPREPTRKR